MSAPEPRLEDLTPFVKGYVEAMFEQAFGDYRDCGWKVPTFSDLAPETRAQIIADCERHQRMHGDMPDYHPEGPMRQGRLFWHWRQKGMVAWAEPQTLQLCDDGKVRFSQAEGAA